LASTTLSTYHGNVSVVKEHPTIQKRLIGENNKMPGNNKDDQYINTPVADDDDFDFVIAYDDDPVEGDERLLPDNTARTALSCGFVGVGGGGGKLANAFLSIGYNKTLLVNTTEKDQPGGLQQSHFILVPGADGVGKDVDLGKQVLSENSALVEDAIRTRIGKVDWLFVLAGGGGGTGSACHELHGSLSRYLESVEASGQVVYIVSKPTAQELLNPAISKNYKSLMGDIKDLPHIVIDNEKQLQLLRGKVGMLNMFPSANKNFAKLFGQILKLADEHTEIQTFDSKDLERCLSAPGRIVIGSTIIKDVNRNDLGSLVYQGCLRSSPCPAPAGNAATGTLLLIVDGDMAADPDVSRRLESAFSYVGGRADVLFSGVYIKERIPGLIALTMLGGLEQ
jgi:cell division GTPase FtsZ|tara:strand:- start:5949 stop:7133 length:1185 start_codon:yes stop_codon:yes gene_type:complete